MTDVEIIIRNIVEGQEEVDNLSTAFGELGNSTKKYVSEGDRMKTSLTKHMKIFDEVLAKTGNLNKAMDAAAAGSADFGKETDKTSKGISQLSKEMQSFEKRGIKAFLG